MTKRLHRDICKKLQGTCMLHPGTAYYPDPHKLEQYGFKPISGWETSPYVATTWRRLGENEVLCPSAEDLDGGLRYVPGKRTKLRAEYDYETKRWTVEMEGMERAEGKERVEALGLLRVKLNERYESATSSAERYGL